MFIKNKYYQKYKAILKRARLENRAKGNDQYYESHHILPKAVYPQYRLNKRNLVLLTAKEHYVCHHLLCRCTSGKNKIKMTRGFWKMLHSPQQAQRITANVYQRIRAELSDIQREQMLRDNRGFSFKDHKHTSTALVGMLKGTKKKNKASTKKSISRVENLLTEHNFKLLGLNDTGYMSIECHCGTRFKKHRQYLTPSKFNKEMCKTCNPRKPMTSEHRRKIGNAHKGRVVSAETRQKLSDSIRALHRTAK